MTGTSIKCFWAKSIIDFHFHQSTKCSGCRDTLLLLSNEGIKKHEYKTKDLFHNKLHIENTEKQPNKKKFADKFSKFISTFSHRTEITLFYDYTGCAKDISQKHISIDNRKKIAFYPFLSLAPFLKRIHFPSIRGFSINVYTYRRVHRWICSTFICL